MIEKRTMGYIDLNYPRIDAEARTVVFNTDSKKVELYRGSNDDDDSSWYEPSDTDRFYPTVGDAEKAMDKYRHDLIAKMPEVKQYLEAMDEFDPADDKNDPLYFDREDYLLHKYANTHKSDDDNYYYKKAARLDKENNLFVQVITHKTLSISADTFRVEDVVRLKWGKECVELTLNDDRTIVTKNEYEYNVVRYIFGRNYSDYTYSRLN